MIKKDNLGNKKKEKYNSLKIIHLAINFLEGRRHLNLTLFHALYLNYYDMTVLSLRWWPDDSEFLEGNKTD